MRHKIFITEPIHQSALARLAVSHPIEIGNPSLSRDEIKRRVNDATVILSKTDPLKIDREIIDSAPQLQHIARHGAGYNNVDVRYATAKGITVSYVRGASAASIAEYTVGLMVMAARNLVIAIEDTRTGNPSRERLSGMELSGKTFGIIGLGAIGREVAKRVHAFGMEVISYHPRLQDKDLFDLQVALLSLEDLLARSDVVSIHVPLNAETQNMIGRHELSLMKRSAYLLNLARGGIVDEAALADALNCGKLAGVVTDVLVNEPVTSDEPLLRCKNCIVLPHIASMTAETQERTAMMTVENILSFCRGERPPTLANAEAWNLI